MKHLFAVATVVGFAFCAAVPSASPKIRPATLPAVPSLLPPQPANTKINPKNSSVPSFP